MIGCDTNGAAEALFLRGYSSDITLMPLNRPDISSAEARALIDAGIRLETGALLALEPGADHIIVRLDRGAPLTFDVIYPALGCRPRSILAEQLGLRLTEDGCVTSDSILDSRAAGVFAAGDLVEGLDQVSVAMGHGAVAATRAHNWLREQAQATLRSQKTGR